MRCYLIFWAEIFSVVFSVNSYLENGFNKLKMGESAPSFFRDNPLLLSLKKYHVFTPHQFEDIGHARKKRDLSTEVKNVTGLHLRNTYFSVEYYGKKYILDLSLNEELLPLSFATSSDEGGKIHVQKPSREERNHCYYQGKVRGIHDSLVIMSTCNGLRGSIILPDEFLLIEPLSEDSHTNLQGGSHVMFRHSDMKQDKPPGDCGNHDHEDHDVASIVSKFRRIPEFTNHTRSKRASERKFVELMVVADRLQAEKFPDRQKLHDRIKDMVNHIDGFYNKLGIRVVLSYIEVWTPPNGGIELSTSAGAALGEFLDYRLKKSKSDPTSAWNYADNFHLIYGGDFDGSTIGMATVQTMCGSRSGGVNQDSSAVSSTAATVAHEMGHNFGMYHDSESCVCPEGAHCIMAASAGYKEPDWSSCSKEYLEENLKYGIKSCLVNVPDPSRIYGGPQCGNDIVEEGEECDCGLPGICTSKCCNATTCQLMPEAVCDIGVCCENCQYLKPGSVCRGTDGNECNLPEYCTGLSPNCPMDMYIENGWPCQDKTAACHDGICLTHSMQCASIWGEDATNGIDACYINVNRLGNVNGNCGRNDAGTFIKCNEENAKCGKLLCQGGESFPLIGRDRTTYINTVTSSDGVTTKCRTIQSSAQETDMSDPGLVRDGTMCDENKVCQEGECVNITALVCSEQCNGNGVCNNFGHCHCNEGWAPPYCTTPGNGGSMDSGPITVERINVQVILLAVMCLVVLPLILAAGTFVWFVYCGGRIQVQTWKKNRERRLSAVRKIKKGGGNINKSRHVSASKENLVGAPRSIVRENNFNSWKESTDESSSVHYANASKPSSHAPPSRPAPPRPPLASAPPRPPPASAPPPSFSSKPPVPSVNKPSWPPSNSYNSSNVAPQPSYPQKPPVPPQNAPARSAPPPPRPVMQNPSNKFNNPAAPLKPIMPKPAKPPARTKPAATPKPEPNSSDSPEMSVMERARKFNRL